MSEREALRGALLNVLCNASNYPKKVQPHILGQDMGPLVEKAADAVLAAMDGDWLRTHDAEVRKAALAEAADVCQRIQDDPEFPESGVGVVTAKIILRSLASPVAPETEK